MAYSFSDPNDLSGPNAPLFPQKKSVHQRASPPNAHFLNV